ncbi:uncharacterized protein N7479_003333 [Penicillium vulpinum]|uniref:uncharacterized protein n=1 Tax=Penicillium vulpinum TaxID=29845 RepID=UPI00254694B4|nr:uncharacterized protein N7479_003333 [Penicillium vulpinum]KAJ5963457.1 hypothetical protein N7479_003333 [Penicillium vulpinum]
MPRRHPSLLQWAQISRTVVAARLPRAWALGQHVALVSVQIWRLILTTVDLVRGVRVLELIRIAARGNV